MTASLPIISTIPQDILWKIASHFPVTSIDFANLQKVCKAWCRIVRDPAFLCFKLHEVKKIHYTEIFCIKNFINKHIEPELDQYRLLERCTNLHSLEIAGFPDNLRKIFSALSRTVREVFLNRCSFLDCLPAHLTLISIDGCSLQQLMINNELPALRILKLTNGALITLCLKGAVSLIELDVSGCSQLKKIDLTNLEATIRKLNFNSCTSLLPIPLKQFSRLVELQIGECNSYGVLDLENMSCLKKITAHKMIFRNIVLNNLPNFEELIASDYTLTGQVTLIDLPQLTQLFLKLATGVHTVFLHQLPALKRLSFEHAVLLNFKSMIISELPNLEEVTLWDMPKLTQLNLKKCGSIQSFHSRKCKNLEKIDLKSSRKIREISIQECPKIKKIIVNPFALLKKVALSDMKRWQKCWIYTQLFPSALGLIR